eukprot:2774840-Pyramimonas_sp.AAC.1
MTSDPAPEWPLWCAACAGRQAQEPALPHRVPRSAGRAPEDPPLAQGHPLRVARRLQRPARAASTPPCRRIQSVQRGKAARRQ